MNMNTHCFVYNIRKMENERKMRRRRVEEERGTGASMGEQIYCVCPCRDEVAGGVLGEGCMCDGRST